jgi:hypothetical protein
MRLSQIGVAIIVEREACGGGEGWIRSFTRALVGPVEIESHASAAQFLNKWPRHVSHTHRTALESRFGLHGKPLTASL